jgi:AraC-like DNA-binding protein
MQEYSSSHTETVNRTTPRGTFSNQGRAILFARRSALDPFIDFLKAVGAPIDRWTAKAHIDQALIGDAERLITIPAAYRFLELAARRERMDDLGMIVGQRLTAFQLGAYGESICNAATAHDFLSMGAKLIGNLTGGTRTWLSTEGDLIRLNQHVGGPVGVGRSITDIYTLAIIINTLRQAIGQQWCPAEIRLMAGSQRSLGDRRFWGDAVIDINHQHTSFTISRSDIMTAISAGVRKPSTAASHHRIAIAPMPKDFLSSVEQLILSLRGDVFPDIGIVAHAAGMTHRTLQRRLLLAGTNYRELIKECKTNIAKHWLSATDIPIADISFLLGYSNPSNFARAFCRATGVSPTAFRQVS